MKGEQYRAKDAALRYASKDRHWTGYFFSDTNSLSSVS